MLAPRVIEMERNGQKVNQSSPLPQRIPVAPARSLNEAAHKVN